MSAPTVLHAILTLERAGAQEVVRTLVEQHAALGGRSVVATFEDGAVRADLEAAGVAVRVLGTRRRSLASGPAFLAELRSIRRRLAELAREERVDVLQTHLLETLDLVLPRLRADGAVRGLVWTFHNTVFLPGGRRVGAGLDAAVHALGYRARAGAVDAAVAVSDRVADAVRGRVPNLGPKLVTIPNGVDAERLERRAAAADRGALEAELDLAPGRPLVLTVGRLAEQKGQHLLLEAFARVRGGFPGARLAIAGEGPREGELRRRAEALGVAADCRFLGSRTDVPALLARADAFVLPSLWEGLSVVLLEALALGAPTVATAVSGTDEVLRDGEHGRVVPPGDVDALAAALRATLAEPEAARARAARGRDHVRARFGARGQAEAHLALYERVLSAGGPR